MCVCYVKTYYNNNNAIQCTTITCGYARLCQCSSCCFRFFYHNTFSSSFVCVAFPRDAYYAFVTTLQSFKHQLRFATVTLVFYDGISTPALIFVIEKSIHFLRTSRTQTFHRYFALSRLADAFRARVGNKESQQNTRNSSDRHLFISVVIVQHA